MSRSPIHSSASLACVLALAVTSFLAATEASAQSGMKRSAGTTSRSAGSLQRGSDSLQRGSDSRRGGSLASESRGHERSVTSERTTTKPVFRSPDDRSGTPDGSAPRAASEGGGEADAMTAAGDTRSSASGLSSGEEPEVDYGSRTLGRACMYGVRGEVIFRPAGARCRGDAPPAAAVPERLSAPAAPSAGPEQRPALRKPKPSSRRPRAAGARGRCIIGADGRVIHSPPGVVCRR